MVKYVVQLKLWMSSLFIAIEITAGRYHIYRIHAEGSKVTKPITRIGEPWQDVPWSRDNMVDG